MSKKRLPKGHRHSLVNASPKTGNRVLDSSASILEGKEYFDYLFKIMESYIGTAKVYTGISTALLSIPFFKVSELSDLVRKSPCAGTLRICILLSWCSLGLSIVFGAIYQYYAAAIIEDEVEFHGKRYDFLCRQLRLFYCLMLLLLLAGGIFTIGYLFLLF